MRLAGKVALITGSAAGIGLASVGKFLKEGAKVIAVDIDDSQSREALGEIDFDESFLRFHCADVSKAEDCREMVAVAEQAFGRLDILFNNAGIMASDDGDSQSTEDFVWDKTMAVNVKGVFYGCKYGIPALRRAGGGVVINTASFVALLGAATPQLAYTASKGAVLAMTRELAVVHARENIRINALCPGPLKTELLMKFLDTEAKRRRRLIHVPMGRFGLAEEMADSALFLASDESSYITGTAFNVDGGLTAAYVTPE